MLNVQTEHNTIPLMDYITGHLGESEASQVQSHLLLCLKCQKVYKELADTHILLLQTQKPLQNPIYYTTILPRVHKNLEGHHHSNHEQRSAAGRLFIPLTISILFLTFLWKIPSESITDRDPINRLYQVVQNYDADEIVQAAANEYTDSYVLSNLEVVTDGVAENMKSEHFIREALVQQLESEEIRDADIEAVLSGMNGEQTEHIITGLAEREML